MSAEGTAAPPPCSIVPGPGKADAPDLQRERAFQATGDEQADLADALVQALELFGALTRESLVPKSASVRLSVCHELALGVAFAW